MAVTGKVNRILINLIFSLHVDNMLFFKLI